MRRENKITVLEHVETITKCAILERNTLNFSVLAQKTNHILSMT